MRPVTAQAWIASHAVERKLHLFGELRAENRLLAEAVRARLAGGRGQLTDQSRRVRRRPSSPNARTS